MNFGKRWLRTGLVAFVFFALAPGIFPGERAQSEAPSAATLVDLAKSTAAIDGRNIMVRFRASWCEWCARLEAALHSYELGWTVRENYVLVSLTVQESDEKAALETPGAEAWMERIGAESAGLPFYIFLDANGQEIADSRVMPGGGNIGYPVTPEEIQAFIRLIERTAPHLDEDDLSLFADYLREHAPEY